METAVVALSVEASGLIVQPVADDLCDNGGNDWGEEEEPCIEVSDLRSGVWTDTLYTNLLGTKIVERSYEEGKSGVDGNDPGESASVI